MKIPLVFLDFILDLDNSTFNILLNIEFIFVSDLGLSGLVQGGVDHRLAGLLLGAKLLLLPYHGQEVSPDVGSDLWFQLLLHLPFL